MEKYINGGIVKEITIFYKSSLKKRDVLKDLGDKINLKLYDIVEYPNCLMLDIKKDILKENLCAFLKEFDSNFTIGFRENNNITFIRDNIDMDIDELICNLDDIFVDRYRTSDIFSINSDKYMVDIVFYAFYFDGPYSGGNFNNLVNYLHSIHKKVLCDNKLSGALCFGIN